MPTATVTSKGQITIPQEIRKALCIQVGDRIAFRLRDDGVVEIQPETVDLLALRGILKPNVQGVTLEDMEKAITAGATDQ